jgi:hypothetical protein
VTDTLDRIAELWAKGVITREIGERLDIPKNSICRIVYDARKAGDARFPARQLRPVPKTPKPKLVMGPPMPRRKQSPQPEPKPRAVHPLIYELRPHECRYPVSAHDVGRDAHRFCAKPQAAGSAYCAEHHALCNPPLKPRVR